MSRFCTRGLRHLEGVLEDSIDARAGEHGFLRNELVVGAFEHCRHFGSLYSALGGFCQSACGSRVLKQYFVERYELLV